MKNTINKSAQQKLIYCKTVNGSFIAEILTEYKEKSYYVIKKMDGEEIDLPFALGSEITNVPELVYWLLVHKFIDINKTKEKIVEKESALNNIDMNDKTSITWLKKAISLLKKYLLQYQEDLNITEKNLKYYNIYPKNIYEYDINN